MNISILGSNGTLARQLLNHFNQKNTVTTYSKQDHNFLNKSSVYDLSEKIKNSDIIINCVGVLDKDTWDTFLINTVAPCYLLENLVQKKSKAHFIMIGSHGSMWTSWPGISLNRLSYNSSKKSIQSFIQGLSQSSLSDMKLTLMNLSKFKSNMSNHQGYDIDIVVDAIAYVINKPILVCEFDNYKNDD